MDFQIEFCHLQLSIADCPSWIMSSGEIDGETKGDSFFLSFFQFSYWIQFQCWIVLRDHFYNFTLMRWEQSNQIILHHWIVKDEVKDFLCNLHVIGPAECDSIRASFLFLPSSSTFAIPRSGRTTEQGQNHKNNNIKVHIGLAASSPFSIELDFCLYF